MIPLMLGLGGLIAKVAAAAVIPRVFKALSAMGGTTETFRANPSKPVPETVSAPVQPSEKVLYGRSPFTAHSYRYSTYGERTKEAGDLDSDWGYAGLWHHGPSGLDLATYRTYDSAQGRWISRDPLGEGVDYNLYRYCGNNPISCIDPEGLDPLADITGAPVPHSDSGDPKNAALPSDSIVKKAEDYVKRHGGTVVDPKPSRNYNCHYYSLNKTKLIKKHGKDNYPTWITDAAPVINNSAKGGHIGGLTGPDDVRVGDLALYIDKNRKVVHSGVVVKPNGANSIVEAKWGDLGVYRTPASNVLPNYVPPGGTIQFVHVNP